MAKRCRGREFSIYFLRIPQLLEGHERKKTGDSTQSTRAMVGGMGGGDCVRAMDTFPEIKICLRSTMNEGLR